MDQSLRPPGRTNFPAIAATAGGRPTGAVSESPKRLSLASTDTRDYRAVTS